jgi:hypothetical protein
MLTLLCHSPRIKIKESKLLSSKKSDRAMDVELQILKHLKRDPQPTVAIIDRCCEAYNDLFPEVRSYPKGYTSL